MSRNILCAVYLLIAISAVHSALYNRFGREVVVPTVEEVEVSISELKKDEPVFIDEVVAVPASETVESIVKNIPIVEDVRPIVENVEANNIVADPKKVDEFIGEEGRTKPNQVLRFDTLEVIQPGVEKSEKVATLAETVKNAAIQAIEKQNEETAAAESVQIVEEPTPEVKEPQIAPVVKFVVENVDASVKLPEVTVKDESVVSVVETDKVVQESVRSADPEAKPQAQPEEQVKEEKIEVAQTAEKSIETPVQPAIRQQPGPLAMLQNQLTEITSNIQHGISTFIASTPFGNNANRPQSDASNAESQGLNTAEQAPATIANSAAQGVSVTTQGPNFLQNVQQAITQFTNNIIPAQLRPTTAPVVAAAAPVPVVSGTRDGEDSVQVVHNIELENVNDKVDLAKNNQQ